MLTTYYLLNYDEATGEILNFWNPANGECPYFPTIQISLETHKSVSSQPHLYLVKDKRLYARELEAPTEAPVFQHDLSAGFVFEDECYALTAHALCLLYAVADSENGGSVITYTKEGAKLVSKSQEDAKRIRNAAAEHIRKVYSA